MVSEYYTPDHESGIRWDDPAFGIEWPYKNEIIISGKDQQWRDFNSITDGILFSEED